MSGIEQPGQTGVMTIPFDSLEVERVIIALGYADTTIPGKFLESEKVAKGKYGVRGNMPQMPGFPSSVLSLEDGFQISVQGPVIQAQKEIPKDQRDIEDSPWDMVISRAEGLFKDLSNTRGGTDCEWAGIIFMLNLSDASASSGDDACHRWLQNLGATWATSGTVAGTSVRVGWTDQGGFSGVNVEGYEVRNFEIPQFSQNQSGVFAMDMSKATLVQAGIRFTVDYNNRAAAKPRRPRDQVDHVLSSIVAGYQGLINRVVEGIAIGGAK